LRKDIPSEYYYKIFPFLLTFNDIPSDRQRKPKMFYLESVQEFVFFEMIMQPIDKKNHFFQKAGSNC